MSDSPFWHRAYTTFVVAVVALLSTAGHAQSSASRRSVPAAPAKVAQLESRLVFAVLKDGTLAGISMVKEGTHQIIQMQTSVDDARTWTSAKTVLTLPDDSGGWGGPEVLVDHKGEVHLIFLNDAKTGIVRSGEGDPRPSLTNRHLDIWHATSSEGRTRWQQPVKIWEGYTGSLNSIIQMKSGRIVLPFSYRTDRSWKNRGEGADAYSYHGQFDSTVLYSDDDGATWRLSPSVLRAPTPDISTILGAIEPVVIQLKDGRVWMLIRTQMGRFYESFSADGAVWSDPQPTDIISSDSPAGLARIPDGRIVMLWNECLRFPYAYGGRHVLHGAVSDDEGKTWRGHREVMRDPHRNEPPPPGGDFGTAYPFPLGLPDGKVLFTSGQGGGRRASYILDPDWLLETRQSTKFAESIDDWSTYGTKGVELVNEVEGEHALRIAKSDPKWPAAAVWNFPAGSVGSVTIEFSVEPGFQSLNLGLTDHYSTPLDDLDQFHNVFNLPIRSDAALLSGGKLHPGTKHSLKIAWDTDQERCQVFVDGRLAGKLKQQRVTTGLNYIRFRSTANTAETGGLKLSSLSVDVSPTRAIARAN